MLRGTTITVKLFQLYWLIVLTFMSERHEKILETICTDLIAASEMSSLLFGAQWNLGMSLATNTRYMRSAVNKSTYLQHSLSVRNEWNRIYLSKLKRLWSVYMFCRTSQRKAWEYAPKISSHTKHIMIHSQSIFWLLDVSAFLLSNFIQDTYK